MTNSPISIAPFEMPMLRALRGSDRSRTGALMRLETPAGFGFASLFTWPELGDPTLNETLQSLTTEQPNAVARRALAYAELDAQSETTALFSELEPFESHYLLHADRLTAATLAELKALGFSTVKLKATPAVLETLANIEVTDLRDLRFRLDFNGSLSLANFLQLGSALPPALLRHVDFFEDPTMFDAEAWLAFNTMTGLRLALDRAPESLKAAVDTRFDKGPAPFTTVIVKPTIEDDRVIRSAAALNMRRLVYTHNLDHPVGRIAALYSAAVAANEDPLLVDAGGFVGDELFESNAYFECATLGGARPQLPASPHWGFAELLAKENWQRLKP